MVLARRRRPQEPPWAEFRGANYSPERASREYRSPSDMGGELGKGNPRPAISGAIRPAMRVVSYVARHQIRSAHYRMSWWMKAVAHQVVPLRHWLRQLGTSEVIRVALARISHRAVWRERIFMIGRANFRFLSMTYCARAKPIAALAAPKLASPTEIGNQPAPNRRETIIVSSNSLHERSSGVAREASDRKCLRSRSGDRGLQRSLSCGLGEDGRNRNRCGAEDQRESTRVR